MRTIVNAAAILAAFFGVAVLAGSASAVAGTDAAVYTPDISFSSPSPVDGSQISILVIVHNLGDQNATDVQVSAELTSSNELLGTTTISFISAGSQVETAILWNISGEGPMTVTVSIMATEPDVQPSNNNAVSSQITVRARPDLKVDSVTFDNVAPPAGTPAARLFVTVSNVGGSDASLVHITLYDGLPGNGVEIYNTTIFSGVGVSTPQTITYDWALAGHGGRHDIYAVVDDSIPAEKADAQANNWGSGRILVLTNTDLAVTTALTVSVDPVYDGFIIVRSGGSLTLSNSTFTLLQERANQFDIIVENGGSLTLLNSNIVSSFAVGITIRDGGSVVMRAGSSFAGSITSEGGSLWLYNATIGGDIDGSYDTLVIEDSVVNGALTLMNAHASVARTAVYTSGNIQLWNTNFTAEWLTLVSGADPAIALRANSVAVLAGVDAAAVWSEVGSSATVMRLAIFTVTDLTGMPIPGATVRAAHALSGVVERTVTTNVEGSAWAWLPTDFLSEASPQYMGSYLHTATFSTYTTSAVSNMANYPTLTAQSNTERVELTFPVINPADIFVATPGDRVVNAPTEVFDFNQTGNLHVGSDLTVSGPMMVWQSRDFETAVVIDSGKVAIGPGGSIRSNRALNIYLYNASELTAEGGSLAMNAVVTFGTARVNLNGPITVEQGSFILAGSSFSMSGAGAVSGTRLYARGGAVLFEGTTAGFAVVDVQTNGDVQISNSTFTTFTDLTLRSGSAKVGTEGSTVICASGGDAAIEANFIDMKSSSLTGCNIVLFSAATIQARDTVFSSELTGFRGGSAVTFFDVSYPSIDVVDSADIRMFHRLSIRVLDINQNIVTDGEYVIVAVPSGTEVARGQLAATIEKDLAASRITGGFEDFTGNYRVTVTASGTSITRDLVMDQPRSDPFLFSSEIVKPTSLSVQATVEPSSVQYGGQVAILGAVAVIYPNRGSPMFRAGITVEVTDNEGFSQSVETEADGSFNWTGNFTPVGASPRSVSVDVRAAYNDAGGQRTLTITILKPLPDGIWLVIDPQSMSFTPGVGQGFTVFGRVFYRVGETVTNDTAENVLVQIVFVNPFQPEVPSGRTNGAGEFTVLVPGRNQPKNYIMNVVARDEIHGWQTDPQTISATVGAGASVGPTGASYTIYILMGAVGAVGVGILLLLVNARRKSVNYVECGNCGRPAHEGDKKCPSCGCEFEEDIAKCSHCASWIPADAVRCPKCNTEFKPVDDAIAPAAVAPDKAAPEGVKAEVTTAGEPVKTPVAVKKKVLKTAEPAPPPAQPGKPADGPKFENPWDKPGEAPTQQGGPATSDQAKPAEKKPEEKKEKGLFDDL